MSTVGIIVNPHAGKDVRRLSSMASPTSDAVKIAILRRVVAGAAEAGATRILLSSDSHHLASRAIDGLSAPAELIETPGTGSFLDTIAAAQTMWKHDVGAMVVLGGDGTCRDAASGWPDAPMIAISTGTNNVFPAAVDGTSAGVAAALVAGALVPIEAVSAPSKRVVLHIDDPRRDAPLDECALVEAALIDAAFVGARAVVDPDSVRWIIACLAQPACTGLASIAGRVLPVGRDEPGGVLIRLGGGGRRVRVPLAPGTFSTVQVSEVVRLGASQPVELQGGGIIAFDGERTTPLSAAATITASIETTGPRLIDVAHTLTIAAAQRRFDVGGDDDGR